jgi:hypothetical protein
MLRAGDRPARDGKRKGEKNAGKEKFQKDSKHM